METFGLVLIFLGFAEDIKDGKLKQQEEDNFKFLDEIIDKIKQEEDKQ